MKLLLVDDEMHVREGIRMRIDWKTAGVSEVQIANNGVQGLELAQEYEPDIVLTDVRMPRMDGIKMAFAIREILPECSIIFMSGFSDKEYLKSAIYLKAINYVEKPIELEELGAAIKDAVKEQQQLAEQRSSSKEMKEQLFLSMEALRNQLVLDMGKPNFKLLHSVNELKTAFPEMEEDDSYIAGVVEIIGYEDGGEYYIDSIQKQIAEELRQEFKQKKIEAFVGYKDDNLLILYISVGKHGQQRINMTQERVAEWIRGFLNNKCYFLLIIGDMAEDIYQLYRSFHNAAGLLLSGFYYGQDYVLIYEKKEEERFLLEESYLNQFGEILDHGDFQVAVEYISTICQDIRSHPRTFVYEVKNFLCRLMGILSGKAKDRQIVQFESEDSESIRECVWECRFLSQVEAQVIERLQLFYESGVETGQKQLISDKVKYFVSCHYAEPDLSLATIADKLNLTSSYLCILFKKECQMTLTNYIVEYRMERAKEYLNDSERKIKEIALMTGYSDCNYFIKVFKKAVGRTPAEFRKEVQYEEKERYMEKS